MVRVPLGIRGFPFGVGENYISNGGNNEKLNQLNYIKIRVTRHIVRSRYEVISGETHE